MFLFGRPIKSHFREFNCFIPLTNSLDRPLTNFCLCCWFIAVKRPDKAAHTKETFNWELASSLRGCQSLWWQEAETDWAWHRLFEMSKLISSDTLPLTRPSLWISQTVLSIQTWAYWGHSQSNHHIEFPPLKLQFWVSEDQVTLTTEALCHRKAEGKSTFSQWNWLPLW